MDTDFSFDEIYEYIYKLPSGARTTIRKILEEVLNIKDPEELSLRTKELKRNLEEHYPDIHIGYDP
ncbi:MAG: hypothetical protein ACI4WM_02020, partial [Erysipelotrichaceae bacterium]